jgi:hypothetical protein
MTSLSYQELAGGPMALAYKTHQSSSPVVEYTVLRRPGGDFHNVRFPVRSCFEAYSIPQVRQPNIHPHSHDAFGFPFDSATLCVQQQAGSKISSEHCSTQAGSSNLWEALQKHYQLRVLSNPSLHKITIDPDTQFSIVDAVIRAIPADLSSISKPSTSN